MAEKKKTQVVAPGMLRSLNKQVQGGGVQLPSSSSQPAPETVPAEEPQEQPAAKMSFGERLESYKGVKGQGQAIWVPDEVKKELEKIRINASKNTPLRSLAAAMIMTFIEEHPEEIEKL